MSYNLLADELVRGLQGRTHACLMACLQFLPARVSACNVCAYLHSGALLRCVTQRMLLCGVYADWSRRALLCAVCCGRQPETHQYHAVLLYLVLLLLPQMPLQMQAHSHRSELYQYTHSDHLLWPRRWGLIKEEIQHHLVSHDE